MCRQVGWLPPKFSLCLTLAGLPRLPQGRLFKTHCCRSPLAAHRRFNFRVMATCQQSFILAARCPKAIQNIEQSGLVGIPVDRDRPFRFVGRQEFHLYPVRPPCWQMAASLVGPKPGRTCSVHPSITRDETWLTRARCGNLTTTR